MTVERIRFDALVRSERYFTATLLPVILFHDAFRGLREFIALLDKKTTSQRDRNGDAIPVISSVRSCSPDSIEIITESRSAFRMRFSASTG